MRAQAHTLEGVVAGILLLSSVVFALQVTAVTPLSASTSSQHIENQQRATADGVLAVAAESGALERAVLFWNESSGFHGSGPTEAYYTGRRPPNEFGRALATAFGDSGVTYNVFVVYQLPGGDLRRQRMVYRGEASDNAVTASKLVTLSDDDVLSDADGTPTDVTLDDANIYAPDAAPSGLYNVVRVEVVVWRM